MTATFSNDPGARSAMPWAEIRRTPLVDLDPALVAEVVDRFASTARSDSAPAAHAVEAAVSRFGSAI